MKVNNPMHKYVYIVGDVASEYISRIGSKVKFIFYFINFFQNLFYNGYADLYIYHETVSPKPCY